MKYIPAIISVLIVICGLTLYFRMKNKIAAEAEKASKGAARLKKLGIVISTVGVWLFVGAAVTLIFGPHPQQEFTVNIIPPRVDFSIMGYQPSETMIVGWSVMAVLIAVAVILRIFFIPKLSDTPGKFQNAIETIVEVVESYSSDRTVYLGRPMFGFVFAIGATLIGNAVAELMGLRSPSSDLMFTVALSIFAFLMANWYGFRKLSVRGRLKSIARPTPLLIPIRIITDLANPLSMACRLFGNTISGMIVMNLIYSALGNFSAGIPSIIGLYFNVFAALIQTLIFITLTLASINDATAEPDV